MDYNSILETLNKASLFDLWRLNATIRNLLEDPRRHDAIKATLRPGQIVRYFSSRENREIAGRVIKIKRSRILVQSEQDKKIWAVPFYMLNLQGIDTTLHVTAPKQTLSRNLLKVGDQVGFIGRDNRETYGTIIKLNPKTATVKLPTGEQWLVYYQHLFSILDGEFTEKSEVRLIKGEVKHQLEL